MRLLLAAVGSRGDVQPMLALGQAARAAGHEVVVSAPPDFSAWARELGFPFIPAGDSVEAALKKNADAIGGNPVRALGAVRDMFVREVPVWFERTLEAAEGASVIVSANQFAARSVAEHLKIPCVGVIYAPTFLRSRFHPPLAVPWQSMPRWVNSLAWRANDAFIEKILRRPTNDARARLGLAPVPSVVDHYFVGLPYLLASDPLLAPMPPDWERYRVTQTGPWFYDDPTPLAAEVEAFLAAGPPPVYVGFGSMIAKDERRATRAVLEGTRERRVLLAKGWGGLGDAAPREGMMVLSGPVSHPKLFPRVAVAIHHGGAGTTATALRAGTPQVIVPHLMDQHYWAHRLEASGLAPHAIHAGNLSGPRLAAAIDAALGLPPQPRRAAALRLAAGDGSMRAVRFLEDRVRDQLL